MMVRMMNIILPAAAGIRMVLSWLGQLVAQGVQPPLNYLCYEIYILLSCPKFFNPYLHFLSSAQNSKNLWCVGWTQTLCATCSTCGAGSSPHTTCSTRLEDGRAYAAGSMWGWIRHLCCTWHRQPAWGMRYMRYPTRPALCTSSDVWPQLGLQTAQPQAKLAWHPCFTGTRHWGTAKPLFH